MKKVERIISVKDMLWNLIYKWKVLVVFSIVFGAILGGIKISGNGKQIEESINESSEPIDYENLFDSLREDEKMALETAIHYNNLYQNSSEYLKKSVLMNNDLYSVCCMDTQYLIVASDDEYPVIMQCLRGYIDSGAWLSDADDLKKQLGIDDQYLQELVVWDAYLSDHEIQPSLDNCGSRTFVITCKGVDNEMAKLLSNEINDIIRSFIEKNSFYFNGCMVEVVYNNAYVTVDEDGIRLKSEQLNYVTKFKSELSAIRSAFSENQQLLYDYYTTNNKLFMEVSNGTDVVNNDIGMETSGNSLFNKSVIKFIIIGLIVGFLISCVGVSAQYIASDIIRQSEELRDAFEVVLFGDTSKSSNHQTKIDCYRYRNNNTFDTMLDNAISNLCLYCEKEKVNSIYITSTEHEFMDKEEYLQIISTIRAVFNEIPSVNIYVGTETVTNKENREALKSADMVLVVEKMRFTKHANLSNLIYRVKSVGIDYIGAISI